MRRKLKVSRSLGAVALIVFFTTFLIGVAFAHTPSPSVCNDSTCNIDVGENYFLPSSITIRPPHPTTGQFVTLIFQNHGALTHTVTSGPTGALDGIFDQTLLAGGTYQLQINQAIYNQLISRYPSGVVPYYCRLHYFSGMTATLTIAGEPIPEFSLQTFLLTIVLISSVLLAVVVRYRKRA